VIPPRRRARVEFDASVRAVTPAGRGGIRGRRDERLFDGRLIVKPI
jgi:hypothetical protein